MARVRIKNEQGLAALAIVEAGMAKTGQYDGTLEGELDREQLATTVRYLLQLLEAAAPGNTVEVRVPPFGAIQCLEGPRHTRGTPPNVVEMDPLTWVAVATGIVEWSERVAAGAIHCSGTRASLEELVPLAQWKV